MISNTSGNNLSPCSDFDYCMDTNIEQNQTFSIKQKFAIKGAIAICNDAACGLTISFKNHAINNLRTHLNTNIIES